MDRTRRGLLAATATLATSGLYGCTTGSTGASANAAEPSQGGWNGRDAITKTDFDKLMRDTFAGQYTCVRTMEGNEGPYYYQSSLQRRAVMEGHTTGVPLRLGIRVANALRVNSPCAPLSNAVVDIWQADAEGMYSNVGHDLQVLDTVGQTFGRGHQVTDNDGYVEFDTIVPGWELVAVPTPAKVAIRVPHIHVKIFHESQVTTTIVYFPDTFIDELYTSVEPYKNHSQMRAPGAEGVYTRIRNEQDGVFRADQSAPLTIERSANGISAVATVGLVSMGTRGGTSLFR